MGHVLDRPVWAALTTRQGVLAIGDARAWRYRPEINLFAAAADRSETALAALAGLVRGRIGTVEADPLPSLPGLQLERSAIVDQMIASGSPGSEAGFSPLALHQADGPEMLALATLTEPGPFFEETWRMGRFIGVREDGRLIAMAGERMRAPGFTEVSGVCTHPEFQGRGLARKLMRAVIDRIVREGDAAFLHVYPHNAGAIGLYETLGFRRRRQLSFQTWQQTPPSQGEDDATPFNRYSTSRASRGVRASTSSDSTSARMASHCSSSACTVAANSGRSSSPAAMPPVFSRPLSSFFSTSRARASTGGGRPASLATASP